MQPAVATSYGTYVISSCEIKCAILYYNTKKYIARNTCDYTTRLRVGIYRVGNITIVEWIEFNFKVFKICVTLQGEHYRSPIAHDTNHFAKYDPKYVHKCRIVDIYCNQN